MIGCLRTYGRKQPIIALYFESETELEVIKLEFILKLKIKRNDWLLADTCPQAANQYALFWVWDRMWTYNGSFH